MVSETAGGANRKRSKHSCDTRKPPPLFGPTKFLEGTVTNNDVARTMKPLGTACAIKISNR